MISLQNKENCCGCYACESVCPRQCISMQTDKEGFWYPKVDLKKCIDCGLCSTACPTISPTNDKDNKKLPNSYGAYATNEQIRMNSSSGGLFTVFAEKILEQGGVVFGAAFSNDCRSVLHIGIEKKEDLWKLRGSKYLQSKIGDSLQKAKEYLKAGRKVLFTGTPCQIEGLKGFLHQEYENLYCIDVICHGVPSPNVWRKYVDYRESCAGVPVQRMFFRHKKYGWKTFAVLFKFSNNTAYEQVYFKDPFMQAFLRNACLRPSCASCHFKKMHHLSDLTLGDFWGVNDIIPEWNDDKGISLAIVHTPKGNALLKETNGQVVYKCVDTVSALKYNDAMLHSARSSKSREYFFEFLDEERFPKLVKCYARKENICNKIFRKVLSIISK